MKDYLIKFVLEKVGLILIDLFDICFEVVNCVGEIEYFEKIDLVGFNGICIIIKLFCGMLFICYLLSD